MPAVPARIAACYHQWAEVYGGDLVITGSAAVYLHSQRLGATLPEGFSLPSDVDLVLLVKGPTGPIRPPAGWTTVQKNTDTGAGVTFHKEGYLPVDVIRTVVRRAACFAYREATVEGAPVRVLPRAPLIQEYMDAMEMPGRADKRDASKVDVLLALPDSPERPCLPSTRALGGEDRPETPVF